MVIVLFSGGVPIPAIVSACKTEQKNVPKRRACAGKMCAVVLVSHCLAGSFTSAVTVGRYLFDAVPALP